MLKTRNDLKDIIITLLTGIRSLHHSSWTPLETPSNVNQEKSSGLTPHSTQYPMWLITQPTSCTALYLTNGSSYLTALGRSLGPRAHSYLLTSIRKQSCTDATDTKGTRFKRLRHGKSWHYDKLPYFISVSTGFWTANGKVGGWVGDIPFSTTTLRYCPLEF